MKDDVIKKGVGTRVLAFHDLRLLRSSDKVDKNATLTLMELEKSEECSPLDFSLNHVDVRKRVTPPQRFVCN